MTGEKRLFRSRKALIGGVCAGVADYFNVDPVVVRILAVVFAFASAGLLIIPYVALWVVVPLEPKEVAPLDVQPQSVHSETYGAVDMGAPRKSDPSAPNGVSPAQAAGGRYTHASYAPAAHVPPEPPAGAARVRPVPPVGPTGTVHPPFAPPPTPPSYEGWASVHSQPTQPPAQPSRSGVKAALWVGSFLLFFGVSALFGSMVEGIVWWQYWPLIFVILGIVYMVIPAEEGHRMRRFVDGLMSFCAGTVLLAMSVGILAWQSLELMVMSLWPLLLMVVGLLLLGGALKSPSLTLLAGVLFAGFCVVGAVWYSAPGATEELVFSAPYGRDYHFDVQVWEDADFVAASSAAAIV